MNFVNRVLLILILVFAMLVPIGAAMAQGVDDLPAELVDIFDIAYLPVLLGVSGAFIQYWLNKLLPTIDSNLNMIVTVVIQMLVTGLVLILPNLIPLEVIAGYQGWYTAILAFLLSLGGNQVAYHSILRPAQTANKLRAG